MLMSSDDDRDGLGARFRSESVEFCGQLSDDFVGKLKIDGAGEGLGQREEGSGASEGDSRDSFESAVSDQRHEVEEEDEDDDEEEFEFSFACVNPDGSPASADDVFQDGQIRPAYLLFDRSLLSSDTQNESPGTTGEAAPAPIPRPRLKKLFFEMAEGDDLDGLAEGTYCVWNGKTAKAAEGCRKSNSTGFSKLWRFRDLVHRSSSDGKDAFVFLNPHRVARGGGDKIQEAKKDEPGREKAGRTAVSKEGKMKSTVTVMAKGQQTAHEKHYVRNRAARESDRRKSYLPYRQDLVGVGFFTNVTGMTRNVHPF